MIPALSIRQPWAWLIVNGHKDIENRTWYTKYRGPILIHAAKTIKEEEEYHWECFAEEYPEMPGKEKIGLGGIVGSARIIDCVNQHDSFWFEGPHGFVLRDQKVLPFQPCRGQLGFFAPRLKNE